MEKKEIEKEFEKVNYEIRYNKPDVRPYSPSIVKRREFLLFAQVHLVNILDAKKRKDEWDERFETETYNKVMGIYYNWEKNE